MWFTETPWPPMIIVGAVGFVCVLLAGSKQQVKLWIAALLCAIGCVAIWVVERNIITEGEKIEQHIYDLADAFHRNDVEGTLSFISPGATILAPLMSRAVDMVDIQNDYRITDLRVDVKADGTLATSHFRANATASLASHGDVGYQPTRWEVGWRKEAGEWKIVEVTRLSVVGDRPMNLLERAQ